MYGCYLLLLQEADYYQGTKRLHTTAVPSLNLPDPGKHKVSLWNLDLEADIEMLEANAAGSGDLDFPANDADTADLLAFEPEIATKSAALGIKLEIRTKDVGVHQATQSLAPSVKDHDQTKTQDKDQTIADLLKQVENLKVRYIKMSAE